MSTTKPVGRYQILGELGRGAMGIVYRAQDPAIGRVVAIKTIRLSTSSAADREDQLDRLRREAQLAGRLSHPGVVTVFDFIEDGDSAYVCMELVEGDSLAKAMDDRRAFSGEEVLSILRQAAEALDYAHSRGVVHRDIKPANILLHSGSEVKLTDFGVAKVLSEEATLTGDMPGTPGYMSPEQIHSRPIGGRSDQFSLAVVAYEMLTGEKPFAGYSVASIVYKVCNEPPVAPSTLNASLKPPVDAVFAKALAKDPAIRFPNVGEFVAALGRAVSVSTDWHPLVRSEFPNDETARAAALPALLRKKGRRSPVLPYVYAVLGFAAVAAIFWAVLVQRNPRIPKTLTQPPPLAAAPPAVELEKSSPAEAPVEDPAATLPAELPIETEVIPPALSPSAAASRYAHDVAIDSDPSGAVVQIDNIPSFTCVTPCRITLGTGSHSLKFEKDGHRPRIAELEVPGLSSVFLKMEQRTGTVIVKSDPPGATVLVNGQEHEEKTPLTLTLPVGLHKLIVRREGVLPNESEVNVRDGAISTLDVNWKK